MVIVALAGRRIDAPGAAEPRFPLENRHVVAQRLHQALARLQPRALVSSAACGADLLALQAARGLGIRTRIVLPFDPDRFRSTSVVDRPGDWGVLFDQLCNSAQARSDLVILGLPQGEAAYRAVTERILDEALVLARSLGGQSHGITAIVVWDRASRGPGDLTAEFKALAHTRGFVITEIDTLHGTEVDRNVGSGEEGRR